MNVGFQGESGAFSEEAARAYFGDVEAIGYRDFDALVDAVDRREVERGLLPCENSISGSIARAYDLLLAHENVTIVGETRLDVVQCLIGTPGAAFAGIERVRSHPVALEQCRRFLKRNPHLRPEPVDDTAGAVRAIVEARDPSVAAIGPELAAVRYGAAVLVRGTQDEEENVTRFFAIARGGVVTSGHERRMCLAFVLAHEAGSLHKALGTIASAGLNLRSLVARPRPKRPFEYVFYAELDAPEPIRASQLARAISPEARILGRY